MTLKWVCNENITHRYYPDFYLPEYGVYLDPKNEYLIKKDQTKIRLVQEQNQVRVIVLNKSQLSWSEVLRLI